MTNRRNAKSARTPSAREAPAAPPDGRHAGVVIRFAPMHEQVLPHIRRDIIEGRWKAGTRLPEPLLCREFGISRTPLRQALKSLEMEGLLRLVPHVGAIVTDPAPQDVGEQMDLLVALEQHAAMCVAHARTAATDTEIKRLDREMRQAARHGDSGRYYALNDEFHRTIVKGTGNRRLIDLHEKIMWHVHRERHRVNEHEPFSRQAASNHAEIVSAITAGKPDKAGQAMRRHLQIVCRTMLARRMEVQAASEVAGPQRASVPSQTHSLRVSSRRRSHQA